jgi:hypothetical protein
LGCVSESVGTGAAPGVADGQGHCIGRIGGFGGFIQVEDAGHHESHLGLIGPTRACDRGFHFGWCVLDCAQAVSGRDEHGHSGSLGGADDRHEIVLGEDSLHGHHIRMMAGYPLFQTCFDEEQALGRVESGWGADDSGLDQLGPPRRA